MQTCDCKDWDWYEKERLHFAAGEGDIEKAKELREKPEGKQVHKFLCQAAKRCNPHWPRLSSFLEPEG